MGFLWIEEVGVFTKRACWLVEASWSRPGFETDLIAADLEMSVLVVGGMPRCLYLEMRGESGHWY